MSQIYTALFSDAIKNIEFSVFKIECVCRCALTRALATHICRYMSVSPLVFWYRCIRAYSFSVLELQHYEKCLSDGKK